MSSELYTTEELLFDLDERIDRGLATLRTDVQECTWAADVTRLNGKIEVLLVVKDWLRSYNVG